MFLGFTLIFDKLKKVGYFIECYKNKKRGGKGNNFFLVYYKPKAVEEIIKYLNKNKVNIEYTIVCVRNTKMV